jgi:cytochrome b involved in lipid metabolism
VSERSRFMPRANGTPNGGFPEGQRPIGHARHAPEMRLPVYSWDEVRRHSGGDSTWIVIDGDVYDVTGWLSEHPGGAERLLEWAGKDATAAFREAKHGPLTQVLRLNYRVGRVEPVDATGASRAAAVSP